jgi:Cd2+/Zn2+-exporting ATPase
VAAESRSNHPIAKGLLNSLKLEKNLNLEGKYNEIAGFGIETTHNNHLILLGNDKLLESHNITFDKADSKLTVLYLSVDEKYVGYIVLEDTPKANSKELVSVLSDKGIKTVMLTGGREDSASYMCGVLGIKEYKADLLPDQKVKYLSDEISKRDNKTAIGYIGDGINDAPCIIASDVGFAMGGLGSDASVENADVIIMNDDPIKVLEAIDIAKKTRRRAISCIAIALLVKVLVMVLYVIFKDAMPFWIATIADSGLAVALIVYSVLLIKSKVKIQ